MQIKRHASFGWVALILVAIWGCTELSDDHNVHPGSWSIEHQAKIRAVGYDLISCKSCHGDDLTGSDDAPGCSSENCHRLEEGQSVLDAIYACNNCHTYREDSQFEDVVGNSSTDSVTVGVHTSHYTNPSNLTVNVGCASCHVVPDSAWAAGHIDDSPYAEVTFDTLATDDGSLTPVWDRQNATCASVYCHGAFDFNGVTGNDIAWSWTTAIDTDLCGTCHGLPPPENHIASSACGVCHSSVVSSEDHRTIIDPQKHIDGAKNLGG